MRLLELQLLAYGPFSDVSLVFDDAAALHLIYGPNEAGKSTALRAITGLLYGIPATTRDAHRHRSPDLRIGARLANARRSLTVVRRKGNKNTLLDAAGVALADDSLADLLCGIDEGTFRAMFGLDHESLRRGAEALLRGRGNVGESLFDAGIGGRGIQSVLDELVCDADALYRPRGQTQRINEALRELRRAQKTRIDAELSAEAWETQVAGLEADRAERAALAAEQRRLATEQNALQRALRVLPLLAKLRDLHERLAALGAVTRLAADARERRLAAQRDQEECERQIGRLRGEIERLEASRRHLAVPQSLAELDESLVEDLRNRLGEQRKAASDLPRRQGEQAVVQREIRSLAHRLGGVRTDVDGPRLPASAQARIVKLANEHSGVRANLESNRRHLAELEEKLARQQEADADCAPARDTRSLQRALAAALQVVEVPEQLAKQRRRLERERGEIARDAMDLGIAQRSAAELMALVLPAPESVERLTRRLDAVAHRLVENDVRGRDLERRERENERDRVALDSAGAVPSEDALEAERRRRERAWEVLRARLGDASAASAEELRDFESAVRAADDLADRLRREADRVAQRASLLGDRAALGAERAALDRERQELLGERAAARDEWNGLWAAAAVAAAPPEQMHGLLRRVEDLVQRARRTAELEGEIMEAAAALEERRESLRREVAVFGFEDDGAVALGVLVDAGRGQVDAAAAQASRRADHERSAAELRREIAASRRRVSECAAQVEEWEAAWRDSVAVLGLSQAATPEEAHAVLEQLAVLYAKVDEMHRVEKRIAAMESDAQRFASDVTAQVAAHASSLCGLPTLEQAEQFLRLQRKALADRGEGERLDREIAERQVTLAEQEERRMQACRQVDLLLAEAGAADLGEVEERERSSVALLDMERRIVELEDQLLSAGEGASLDELMEQTRHTDADTASARLHEVNAEIEQANERQRVLGPQIGRNESGLEYLQRERGAGQAAAEVEEKLATLAGHVRRYVRVRLAAAMLDREVERYRRENQGPVLGRAGELFPRLTLGRYSALRVGFDSRDEAVLRCVRSDGAEVDVEALSEGTRDQLYLALRLATVERYAQANEPMPLILDDILIHFDDERARAAFEVLGSFACTTQVLFFTHNAHLRDLAREVVPSERLVEHDLGTLALPDGALRSS